MPTVLHEVPVPIIDKVKCQTMFTKSGHKKIVRDSFLCAGYDEGKRDSCEVTIPFKYLGNSAQLHLDIGGMFANSV